MTTTTTRSPADEAPRPLPLWASVPLILLCLAASGWIIQWYWGNRVRPEEPHLLGEVPARMAQAATAAPQVNRRPPNFRAGGLPPDPGGSRRVIRAVRTDPSGGTLYEARTDEASALWTEPTGAGRQPVLHRLSYGNENGLTFIPVEVRRTIRAAGELLRDTRAIAAIKLSTEQVERLKPLTGGITLEASPADRETIVGDAQAFAAAAARDRDAAKAKLLADLDAVADRSRPATRDAMAARAGKINAVVTADQWAQYKAMGGRP